MTDDDDDNEMIVGNDRAIEASMPICESCGWFTGLLHRCYPSLGRVASALARAFPDGHPTKLGYGGRALVFELDENTHIRFEIGYDNQISLREVWHVGDLGIDQAAAIVAAIRKVLVP